MIEALACGTPVIAWQHGSVSEVLEQGVTGFLCDDVGAAVRAVNQLDRLSRARCRQEFERRFTAERMARDYVAIYERLAGTGERAASVSEQRT
jgi:glycosyltransferase involved in cell wall biosynthesis